MKLQFSAVFLLTFAFGCGSTQAGPSGAQAGSPGGGGAGVIGSGGSSGSVGAGGLNPSATGPGLVTLRRLNAREYDNTIRDLVGLDLKPSVSEQFTADEWGDGFDNDGDVLTTSSLASEKYLQAAQHVVSSAFADGATKTKLIPCAVETDAACASTAISEFARRAFRRPIETGELAPFVALVDLAKSKGDTAEVGVGLAFAALLTSPHFLFLVEPDPTKNVVRQLTPFELGARLSYFAWSSMPDEPLFQAAAQNQLGQPAQIAAQVQRLLADGKASAFLDVLAQQWMQTIALKYAEPNVGVFPLWKESLRPAMEQELRQFLTPIVRGTVPATDLLSANYTYVNRELAEFYGLPGAANLTDQFTRVDVDVTRRGGVLRQGSFLVHTSHPDRNAPTKRGKWILDKLLCDPPPPPPATVPALETDVPFEGTLRQRLEQQHFQAGPTCRGCHVITDPMGFALENYDAIGQWRDQDGAYPVDASGKMPGTDVPFNGPAEVMQAIVSDARFPACVAKQLLTFALGRHVIDADDALVEALGNQFRAGGFKLPQLAELIAQSPAMTSRQTEAQ